MEPAFVRNLRVQLGMTQREIATHLGVTTAAVNNWEHGRSQPQHATKRRLQEMAAQISESVYVKAFRPIQYLGSKARLAGQIAEMMTALAPANGRVADLYSGSAVVSSVLAGSHPVVAIDAQTYSCDLAEGVLRGIPDHLELVLAPAFPTAIRASVSKMRALLAPLCDLESQALAAAECGDALLLAAIADSGSLASYLASGSVENVPLSHALARCASGLSPRLHRAMTASLHFGGPYFSYGQALALDAISAFIDDQMPSARPLLRSVLLSTASTIVATVGKQFAQPMRIVKADGSTQPILLQRSIADRKRDVVGTFIDWAARWHSALQRRRYHDNLVLRGDVASLVPTVPDVQAFYADPPYTIDHYSRFYHVLETIVRRDDPALARNSSGKAMRGVYRADRYQSPFCIPSQVRGAFSSLFFAVASIKRPLLMSYSPYNSDDNERPRLLSIPQLQELALQSFATVEVIEADPHSHRKLNAREMNAPISKSAERFLLCRGARG
jgi:adenine-specific DNA-methyltransferase